MASFVLLTLAHSHPYELLIAAALLGVPDQGAGVDLVEVQEARV